MAPKGIVTMAHVVNHDDRRVDLKQIAGLFTSMPSKSKTWGPFFVFFDDVFKVHLEGEE